MYRRTDTRTIYALTNEGSRWDNKDRFVFYVCSCDGEPSHEVAMPAPQEFDKLVFPASIETPAPVAR